MKQLIAMLCLYTIAFTVQAQTEINQTIPANGATSADLNFEYADVTIKTWDKSEIQITGTISVNKGKDDDAFEMDVDKKNGRVSISTSVDNSSMYNSVWTKKNNKIKSISENKTNDCDSEIYGSHIENTLVIMLPKNIKLKSSSIYGSTKVEGFTTNISIENTYGSVDAVAKNVKNVNSINLSSIYAPVDLSIPSTAKADMELNTEFGQIYSDIDMQINTNRSMHKKMFGENIISTLNGGGIKIKLASNYSKIYVRET